MASTPSGWKHPTWLLPSDHMRSSWRIVKGGSLCCFLPVLPACLRGAPTSAHEEKGDVQPGRLVKQQRKPNHLAKRLKIKCAWAPHGVGLGHGKMDLHPVHVLGRGEASQALPLCHFLLRSEFHLNSEPFDR